MRVRYLYSSRKTRMLDRHNMHRPSIPKLAQNVIRISDIVLEVLDARFIEKTRNKELERFVRAQGKKLVYVLNKADLVTKSEIQRDVDLSELTPHVFFSSATHSGRTGLRTLLKIESKRLKSNRRTHVGVIGYPNTGKSSLINALAGGGKAGVAATPGFTKGIQKIRFTKDILILDTPGVIPDNEDHGIRSEAVKKHVETGVETFDKVADPDLYVARLMEQNPGIIETHFEIECDGDPEVFLEKLGKEKRFLRKGGSIDIDRTARLVLKEWQKGLIGKKKK